MSTQTIDLSVTLVTLVYPILDAVLFFPAVLIFWAVRRRRSRHEGTADVFRRSINSRRREPELQSPPVRETVSQMTIRMFQNNRQ
jgi:hypothetical protein